MKHLNHGKEVSNKHYYKLFELSEDATQEEIKKAYKKVASKHHPDTGGSEESFKELQEAYAVLSNPERRAIYDLSGQETGLTDLTIYKEASTAISRAFSEIVDARLNNIQYVDIITMIEGAIEDSLDDMEDMIKQIKQKVIKYKEVKERLTNSAEDMVLFNAVDIMINSCNNEQAQIMRNMLISRTALKLLSDYEFKTDEKPEQTKRVVTTIMGGGGTGMGSW